MSQPSRRSVMRSIGLGALGVSLWPAWARGSRVAAQERRIPLDEIASRVLAAQRSEVFDLAGELIAAGLSWRALEAGLFVAAVRAIRPDPPGSLSHAILETESVFQLAEKGPEDEAWLAVLFHLDDLKSSQERQADRFGWRLPQAPARRGWDAPRASSELRQSLERGEGDAADQAATALLHASDRTRVVELMWARAVGDLGGLGHKVIHAAHTERVLRRVGKAAEEPALRSLAIGLGVPSSGDAVQDVGASTELAALLPEDWMQGDARPDDSLALARAFLSASAASAREEALAALRAGVGATTVWDAVRLGACDLYARRPALLPVHPTTICNALAFIQRASSVERTRRVAVLQAVSWIPRLRDALVDRRRIPRDRIALDTLLAEPRDALSIEETFADPSPERVRAHLEQGGRPDAFVARLRTLLYRGVQQNHQIKYAAALLEDAGLGHPRWRSVLLAPALGYLPSSLSPELPFTGAHESCSGP